MPVIEIKPIPGSKKNEKRVGRGTGNGRGKTSTRGHKGQKSRSGGGVRPGFEGGQMPIYMRLPKRGFKHLSKQMFNIINVSDLDKFTDGDIIDRDILMKNALVHNVKLPVKLLGNGELTIKNLKIKLDACSATAKQKIEALGGSIEVGMEK